LLTFIVKEKLQNAITHLGEVNFGSRRTSKFAFGYKLERRDRIFRHFSFQNKNIYKYLLNTYKYSYKNIFIKIFLF